MKKMKLFWSLAALIVTALCAGFASCGDDDDDDNANPLVGTWKGEIPHLRMENGKYVRCLDIVTYHFTSKGKYDANMTTTQDDDEIWQVRFHGIYKVDGNKLTMVESADYEEYNYTTKKWEQRTDKIGDWERIFEFTIKDDYLLSLYDIDMSKALEGEFTKQ